MSKLRKTRKLLKKYGFNIVKANRLRKRIIKLDDEAMSLTDDTNKYFANRARCWKLTDQLIKLEVI